MFLILRPLRLLLVLENFIQRLTVVIVSSSSALALVAYTDYSLGAAISSKNGRAIAVINTSRPRDDILYVAAQCQVPRVMRKG